MWDDFFNSYLSNRRYTRSWIFDNRQDPVFELYRLIQQAMDEAVPKEKPEEPVAEIKIDEENTELDDTTKEDLA